MSSTTPRGSQGAIAWMASNSLAANLLMAFLLVCGILIVQDIKQEVFPSVSLDMVRIEVAYPGASPQEVEAAITLALEEALSDINDVKTMNTTSLEGMASVTLELRTGADPDRLLNDAKAAVDRIVSFPAEAEKPIVSLATGRNKVISVVVFGQWSEDNLRQIADKLREDLLQSEGISVVELTGARPREISIETPLRSLRTFGLTLRDIANAVAAGSVEIPAGGLLTPRNLSTWIGHPGG